VACNNGWGQLWTLPTVFSAGWTAHGRIHRAPLKFGVKHSTDKGDFRFVQFCCEVMVRRRGNSVVTATGHVQDGSRYDLWRVVDLFLLCVVQTGSHLASFSIITDSNHFLRTQILLQYLIFWFWDLAIASQFPRIQILLQ
jgi:hypothetical protein